MQRNDGKNDLRLFRRTHLQRKIKPLIKTSVHYYSKKTTAPTKILVGAIFYTFFACSGIIPRNLPRKGERKAVFLGTRADFHPAK